MCVQLDGEPGPGGGGGGLETKAGRDGGRSVLSATQSERCVCFRNELFTCSGEGPFDPQHGPLEDPPGDSLATSPFL